MIEGMREILAGVRAFLYGPVLDAVQLHGKQSDITKVNEQIAALDHVMLRLNPEVNDLVSELRAQAKACRKVAAHSSWGLLCERAADAIEASGLEMITINGIKHVVPFGARHLSITTSGGGSGGGGRQ